MEYPVTLDLSTWYSTTSALLLLALGAIALHAFRVATAGAARARSGLT